jgi:hypothetical protein
MSSSQSSVLSPQSSPRGGRGLTIALLLAGLATISVCAIVPQADANRRLQRERDKLLADLEQISLQTAVNEDFLKNMESDPQLAQRLAQRQMKFIRQGESLLPYKAQPEKSSTINAEVSPFSLVSVPPPAALPPYQPAGGPVAVALLDSHVRLYTMAGGLFFVAMGLILSSNDPDDSRSGS